MNDIPASLCDTVFKSKMTICQCLGDNIGLELEPLKVNKTPFLKTKFLTLHTRVFRVMCVVRKYNIRKTSL